MKLESLVIADQNAAVNTFPALYTPPVTPWELTQPEDGQGNRKEPSGEGGVGDWGEVVTR